MAKKWINFCTRTPYEVLFDNSSKLIRFDAKVSIEICAEIDSAWIREIPHVMCNISMKNEKEKE